MSPTKSCYRSERDKIEAYLEAYGLVQCISTRACVECRDGGKKIESESQGRKGEKLLYLFPPLYRVRH